MQMAEPFNRTGSNGKGVTASFRRRSSITLETIEDLFARAACVQDVRHETVQSVCQERGVDLQRSLARGRAALYGRYLRHCLDDNVLSAEENGDLIHLREILLLSPDEVMDVHDAVAVEVYGEAVNEVLADFRLDDDEAEFLRRLRGDLHLPEDRADQIFRTAAADAQGRAISEASSRDPVFTNHRVAAGEFTGRSAESLEGAINDALAKASLGIPSLHWFEVIQTAGYVENGIVSGWHASLRAGIRTDEAR
jgi:flavin-binding protein dodecin